MAMNTVTGPFKNLAQRAVAIVALLITNHCFAQVDTSEWECQYCPFREGYSAEVSAGAEYVSDDALRFGNFTGYDESGGYALLEGRGDYAGKDHQLSWYAEDLGLESRVIGIEGGRQGRFGLYLEYSELPYRQFDTTSTVFSAASADALVLPAGWVRASSTAELTGLAGALQPLDIASDRSALGMGADIDMFSDFDLFVDYRHQERDGIDIVSGAGFIRSSLLPRTIDFETDTVDLGINYAKGPLNLSLSWYGSFFTNNVNSLTWDNPFTGFPGADQGRMAQEPDNEFQQLSLSGSYRAESIRSTIAFSAAAGTGEQNEPLLPYTINPTLTAGSLPTAAIDGKVDTSNYALTITSNPIPDARIKLAYRFDERDNQTPRYTWSRVIVDGFLSGEDELNTPYSFERARFSASGAYRLFDSVRLSAGFDRTDLERDFQEVADQTEDSGWAQVDARAANWLNVTARGGSSRREIDRYDVGVAASLGQNPLLRKYNLAHRYREFGELMLSLTPAELPVSASLSFLIADDRYSKSELGLTDSETTHMSIDVNFTVSESTSLYVIAGIEDIDANQFGSASFSTPTWQAEHRDSFDHYGAGLVIRGLVDDTDLTIDYHLTNGDTGINLRSAGNTESFPDIQSELESLRILLSHRRSDRLFFDLSYRYENFESNDWALAGVEPDTVSSVLTMGADPYDYSVWVLGLGFRYLVGNGDN